MGIAAVVACAFLLIRLYRLIDYCAIDLLFWDQFGFYRPAWNHLNPWALFNWQYGPHRMGIGLNLMQAINEMSAWNQRVLAFCAGVIVCIAAAGVLWLRKRLTGRIQWYDITIALLFFTSTQWEIYADTVNLSHGALPLLLAVCIALALTIRRPVARYGVVGVLVFLTTFTGFGFFALPATLLVLLIRGAVLALGPGFAASKRELAAIIVGVLACAITAVVFFTDYRWAPAVPNFVFPHPRPLEYIYYMALEFGYVVGVPHPGFTRMPGSLSIAYGCIWLAVLGLAGLIGLWRVWRGRRQGDSGPAAPLQPWYIILFLLLFTGAFLVNSSVGRVCTGLQNAMTSRYVPLLIPGCLALYFAALAVRRPLVRAAALGAILLALAVATSLPQPMDWYVPRKTRWLAAFKETGDVEMANARSGFAILPKGARVDPQKRLDWMRENNLSFFRYTDVAQRNTTSTAPTAARYTGRVQNGVVVFDGPAKPAEGSSVRVVETSREQRPPQSATLPARPTTAPAQ